MARDIAHAPKLNQCVLSITRIGSGGVGLQAWMCAFISEIASCNGGPDVNGDRRNADGTPMGWSGGNTLDGCAIAWTSPACIRLLGAADHPGHGGTVTPISVAPRGLTRELGLCRPRRRRTGARPYLFSRQRSRGAAGKDAH
jgi:hypothetical protein